LRGIRPIRFENESDGRFGSRFDSDEKNDSQVPKEYLHVQETVAAMITAVRTMSSVKNTEYTVTLAACCVITSIVELSLELTPDLASTA